MCVPENSHNSISPGRACFVGVNHWRAYARKKMIIISTKAIGADGKETAVEMFHIFFNDCTRNFHDFLIK